MKRLPFLLGTLGGAMAGYLLSNSKLRDELKKAKDPEAAAKTLARHLQKDGSRLAHEVKQFVESEDVQLNLGKAKKFASLKLKEAKKEVGVLMKKGKKEATKMAKKGVKNVKSVMK